MFHSSVGHTEIFTADTLGHISTFWGMGGEKYFCGHDKALKTFMPHWAVWLVALFRYNPVLCDSRSSIHGLHRPAPPFRHS